jgi:uncharacterized protein YgiM (DUF1202 family)
MPTLHLSLPNGQSYPIPASGLRIGRGQENQIQLDRPGVSRQHALVWSHEGQAYIQDQGSTNGTLVNGRLLTPTTPAMLHPGDSIRIGDVSFALLEQAEAPAPPPPSASVPAPAPAAIPVRPRRSPILPIAVGAGVLALVLIVAVVAGLALQSASPRQAVTLPTGLPSPAAAAVAAEPAVSPPAAVVTAPSPTAAPATAAPVAALALAASPTATARPTITPTPPPSLTPVPDAVVAGATVNLREGPGTDYAVLGQVSRAEALRVAGQSKNCGWLKVTTSSGTTGWVSGDPALVRLQRPCQGLPHGTYRPPTGLLKVGPGGGLGELSVENGTANDGLAVLTTTAGQTVMAAYIRSNTTYKLSAIPDGTYRLYFSTGAGWDGDDSRFTERPRFSRFEDPFPFKTTETTYTIWNVTLQPVAGGKAESEDVNPAQFPGIN